MRKAPLILAAWAIMCSAIAQQADHSGTNTESYQFSLDDCLNYAFSNSYERQNLKLQEKSQDETIEQATSNRRPSVSANASESANHTGSEDDVNFSGSVGLSGQINLYEGGSTTNTIKQSQLQKENAELKTQQYDKSLTLQILNAYLTALQNKEVLKYEASIVETSQEQVQMGQRKYKAGNMLESDYQILEAQYTSNQVDTLNASITHFNSLLSLKKLISMEPETQLTITDPDTSAIDALALLPSQEDEVNSALQTMPELKLNDKAIEIAQANSAITKSGLRPTLSANAGIGTSHRNFDDIGQQFSDNFYQQIGLNLSVPIYDRGQTRSKMAQNKYAETQAELDKKQQELEIKQTVIEQYQNVKLAYQRYKMCKQKADAYKSVYEVYNVKFKVGSVVATDVLQQQDNYINALKDYVQAKYDFILNRKILDVYTGENITLKN